MQYTIRGLSGSEAVETLDAHVLARAYRTMWRARHGSEPLGPHVIASLDLVIAFGVQDAAPSPTGHTLPDTPGTRRVAARPLRRRPRAGSAAAR
jgi:hypothetical protein